MGTLNENNVKKNNTWIYLGIILLLVACNLFLFFQKGKMSKQNIQLTNQLAVSDSTKKQLQNQYGQALVAMDSLVGQNAMLDKILKDKNGLIAKQKAEIQSILKKNNATEAELNRAKELIESLQIKVTNYEGEIAQLKKENHIITQQRDSLYVKNKDLNVQNVDLGEKVELGKVLHVSNVHIVPIELTKNKEKETEKSQKADMLRVYFDIDENKLTEDGDKTFYIKILSPNGNLLENKSLGSGNMTFKNGETVRYSVSKTVHLIKGRNLHAVSVDWQQSTTYQNGAYRIEFYYEGFMIGGGLVELR